MARHKPASEFSHQGVPLPDILKDHEKWIKRREGRKADLIGAELMEVDLSGAYLRGADLIKANLKGVDLREANLSEANLFGANLSGSKMMGANLRRANIEKANLSEANLTGADLTEANLKGAYLAWTKMTRAVLIDARLNEAYMRGADLALADLSKAHLQAAKMIGANLSETRMGGASLREANLGEAYMREANASYADFKGADLGDSNLEKANLRSANLAGANLDNASLVGADFVGADLSGAFLDHANTSEWILRDVKCTHLIRGEHKETVRFAPGEFEKKYGQSLKLSEIILRVPLSASAYYIGKFVTRSINHLVGFQVIDLKGIMVLSPEDTKFIFHIFDDEFYERRKEEVEIGLRVALNKYLREQSIDKERSYFGDIAEGRENRPISRGDLLPDTFTPWHMDHGAMQEQLVEHYTRLGKMGESIYGIISSIFK